MAEPKVTLRCPECPNGTLVERVNKATGGHVAQSIWAPTKVLVTL